VERLKGAKTYRRIAGYFRSSIFELVGEELDSVERIEIVCNGDLDPRDLQTAKALEVGLKEQLDQGSDPLERLLKRDRYKRLYELLKSNKVSVRVVAGEDAPFLRGKAGVVERHDGTKTAFALNRYAIARCCAGGNQLRRKRYRGGKLRLED
jgi:hypothetical protein